MSFTDRKLEIATYALVAVMIGGLGYIFKTPVQAVLANSDVSYEMPRPKSFLAALFGLGLEDREINRKYVNPFDKKKADAKKVADAKVAAPSAPKAVAQKKADAKKPADAEKKPNVDVNVVGAESDSGLAGSDIAAGGNGGGRVNFENNAKTAAAANDAAKDEKGLSGSQWIALVSAQPTKENVAKLINAYFSQEVDDATFYTIVNDLLRNNKSETQAMGLYAVSSVYNSQSFSIVATSYDQLSSENQAKAQAYLTSYANTGRSGVLLTALKSSKAEVVELAAQVIIKGYQTAKSNTTVTDPRNSRGDVVTASNAVSDYSKFIPVFQQLAQSSDAAIVGLANSALSQIQTGVASL
ncbi:hypothetical protein [Bdellovibrio svalbardensis]|uniref:Uncharacterized protein n=1 Tax=Bdellovibrio svalbardensis TaxID=2972972 RepID=A0ABT6DF69_9BACT|nr:hypothetical protein [Bdellovibrio svalbardensis]MDG0815485.1 hypothetical protein [Bdellovibrio svalbardensis]